MIVISVRKIQSLGIGIPAPTNLPFVRDVLMKPGPFLIVGVNPGYFLRFHNCVSSVVRKWFCELALTTNNNTPVLGVEQFRQTLKPKQFAHAVGT